MKKRASFVSAERVHTVEGRQYHLGVAPGEVAPYILLCGDPKRAERTARHFEQIFHERRNREYVTITGRYQGMKISVVGTGIGPDNMEIAVIELAQCVRQPTFLRIGSCGALQKGIRLGDLVISSAAVRLENTSAFFAEEGYPAAASYEMLLASVSGCARLKSRYHVGITASAPGFYGAQARNVPGFPPRFPDLPKRMARMNVLNFEMEVSCLFTLASIAGFRAGAVCAVFAQRHENAFVDTRRKERAEETVILAGLQTFEILRGMDRWKQDHKSSHWHL